jgi:hypothetical protein
MWRSENPLEVIQGVAEVTILRPVGGKWVSEHAVIDSDRHLIRFLTGTLFAQEWWESEWLWAPMPKIGRNGPTEVIDRLPSITPSTFKTVLLNDWPSDSWLAAQEEGGWILQTFAHSPDGWRIAFRRSP